MPKSIRLRRDLGREIPLLQADPPAPLGRLDQERQLGEGGESQQQPHGRQDTPVNHAHRRADETTHDEQDRESERQSKRPHGRQTTSGLDGSSGSGSSTLPSSVEVTRFTMLPLRS